MSDLRTQALSAARVQARTKEILATKTMLGIVYDTLCAMTPEMQARIPTFVRVVQGLRAAIVAPGDFQQFLWAPCDSWDEVDAQNEPLVVAMAVSEFGPGVPAYVTRFAEKLGLDLSFIMDKWAMLQKLGCPQIGLRDFSETEMAAATAAYVADEIDLAAEILDGMYTEDNDGDTDTADAVQTS